MIGTRPENADEARARADNLERLLWLIVRQGGGKITILPDVMMTWDRGARLTTLQDLSNGGMVIAADLKPQASQAPQGCQDPAMDGYHACERGSPCRPPDYLIVDDRIAWIEGWHLRNDQEKDREKRNVSSVTACPRE